MNNLQNTDINLQQVVRNIIRDQYLIPRFQRSFVWGADNVLDLGDSIMRGYPISSLLLMPTTGVLSICSKTIRTRKEVGAHPEDEKTEYVLDGQQRLTSISRLFISPGDDEQEEYYFDLLAILITEFPDDNIPNDAGLLASKMSNTPWSESLCRSFKKAPLLDLQPTREGYRFISGKTIIDKQFATVANKFLEVFTEMSDSQLEKYVNHLNAIMGAVSGYSIPATSISADAPLGVVIRVFEKVNSNGKNLQLFDLINAKSFELDELAKQEGLGVYLTNKINHAIKENPELKKPVHKFLKFKSGQYTKFGKLVHILTLTSYIERGDKQPSIYSKDMLGEKPEFWFNSWNKHGKLILDILGWIGEENILAISQDTFVEYAMAVMLANRKSFSIAKFRQEVKDYALYLTLTDNGFNKNNLPVVKEFIEIAKILVNNDPSNREYESPSKSPKLTKKEIFGITTNKTKKFVAAWTVLYDEHAGGGFTHDIVGNKLKKSVYDKTDNHHLFPKSKVPGFVKDSKFNSIAALVRLDSIVNREDFKDKVPKEYIGEFVKSNSAADIELRCGQNVIDFAALSAIVTDDDAGGFIDGRAEDLAEVINDYFE